MVLTKTLKFSKEVLDVIKQMDWSEDGLLGKITGGQLSRDLYVSVNKALEAMGGKWNRSIGGHVFLVDPRQSVDGLLSNGDLTVERDGFFQTPETVVTRMIEIVRPIDLPSSLTLEPSAGLGAIARYLTGCNLTLIEKNEYRVGLLKKEFKNVLCMDFLDFDAPFKNGNFYDRIYMNPPFEEGQDIDHVRHAYELLKNGGALVSVMGEGAFFRGDKKATSFREWLLTIGGSSEILPKGSFKESGTGVNARLVVIRKEAPHA